MWPIPVSGWMCRSPNRGQARSLSPEVHGLPLAVLYSKVLREAVEDEDAVGATKLAERLGRTAQQKTVGWGFPCARLVFDDSWVLGEGTTDENGCYCARLWSTGGHGLAAMNT